MTHDSDFPHALHLEPALEVVADNAPRERLPFVPSVGDRRASSRMRVAGIWRDAIEDRGPAFGRDIGLNKSTVHRYGNGELAIPLSDVLLAPPGVVRQVLHVILDHVDGDRSIAAGSTVSEVLLVICQATELARRLEATPLSVIADEVLDGLISLGREAMSRLGNMVHSLVKERERRAQKRGQR